MKPIASTPTESPADRYILNPTDYAKWLKEAGKEDTDSEANVYWKRADIASALLKPETPLCRLAANRVVVTHPVCSRCLADQRPAAR